MPRPAHSSLLLLPRLRLRLRLPFLRWFSLLLLLAPLLAAPPASAATADAHPGRALFQRACAGCHGPEGEGGRGPTLAVPQLERARDRTALLKIIDDGIQGTEMPGSRLEPAEQRLVAEWVLRLGRRPVEPLPGDARRGAALYAGKGGCTLCHAIAGVGGTLGPDLTDIGLRRGAAHLRRSLLEPEADLPRATSPYRPEVAIAQNFLQVRLVTRAGDTVAGVRVNEDTFTIQVRDVANRLYSFDKADLRELHKEWNRSPMPSYQDALTPPELDDLVAHLLTLRATATQAPAAAAVGH